MPLNNRMSPAQWQQWLQQVGAPSSSTAAQNASTPQVQAGPQGFLPTSGPRVEINPPGGGGLPGMPPVPPWEDDIFNPNTYQPPQTPMGVWDPVRWNINNSPGTSGIPFDPLSPLYPDPTLWDSTTDPYTGQPRLNLPGVYTPNIFPARPPNDVPSGPYPGSVAPLNRVEPIPTQFPSGAPAMSMPYRNMEPIQPMGMSMPAPDLPPITPPEQSTVGLWSGEAPQGGGGFNFNTVNPFPEFTDYTAPVGDFNAVTAGGTLPGGADFSGAGSLYGGINPWDFNVPAAGGTPAPGGVGAAPAAMTPYDYNVPSNPFNAYGGADLWGGNFTAPQYNPATLSRVLGGSGLPPSGPGEPDIPTPPGVWPDVLPAQPVGPASPTVDPVTGQPYPQMPNIPIDPRTNLPWTAQFSTIPGATMPLGQRLAMPTNWQDSPLGALGRFLGGIPRAVSDFFNQPGYTSPDYLRSIGYRQGQGTGSLFPGGPGRFRDVVTAGDVWGGGQSPGDFQSVVGGPNVIPMTGGVGGGGGSFFTSSGQGLPAFMPANIGGGGPVNPSALGGSLWRIPWGYGPSRSYPGMRVPSGFGDPGHSGGTFGGTWYTPAEHAWLQAGGVRSGMPGPGVFSRFVPVSAQVSQAFAESGPQPRIQPGFASRHVPARQIQ
jgi:hypothetical protein